MWGMCGVVTQIGPIFSPFSTHFLGPLSRAFNARRRPMRGAAAPYFLGPFCPFSSPAAALVRACVCLVAGASLRACPPMRPCTGVRVRVRVRVRPGEAPKCSHGAKYHEMLDVLATLC